MTWVGRPYAERMSLGLGRILVRNWRTLGAAVVGAFNLHFARTLKPLLFADVRLCSPTDKPKAPYGLLGNPRSARVSAFLAVAWIGSWAELDA